MNTNRDKETGRLLPKLAKHQIEAINLYIEEMVRQGLTKQQMAGKIMYEYNVNIHLANALVKNYLLTIGK